MKTSRRCSYSPHGLRTSNQVKLIFNFTTEKNLKMEQCKAELGFIENRIKGTPESVGMDFSKQSPLECPNSSHMYTSGGS